MSCSQVSEADRPSGPVLLTLVSRQIWPQLHAVVRFQPSRVLLLHSQNQHESKYPANRLSKFLKGGALGGQKIPASMCRVPADDFAAFGTVLDDLTDGLNHEHIVFHITGGNKLMALSAFEWCRRRGVAAFYMERFSDWVRFDFSGPDIRTSTESLDRTMLDHIDPIGPVLCQVDASEVERKGERLTLNAAGREMPQPAFEEWLGLEQPPGELLEVDEVITGGDAIGDRLENETALALLALGIPVVRRSVRLKPKSARELSISNPHAEIDLVFVHNGRLWVVDCKDVGSSLTRKQGFKPFKDDLLAAREIGGLDAGIIAVRRTQPDPEMQRYAELNRIELVSRFNLMKDLGEALTL